MADVEQALKDSFTEIFGPVIAQPEPGLAR